MNNIKWYIAVVVIVTIISYIMEKLEYTSKVNLKYDISSHVTYSMISKIAGALIIIILAYYSMALGIPEGLPDRANYEYSYYYRYPLFFDSISEARNSGIELGFLFINLFLHRLGLNVSYLFFVVMLISVYINLKAIRLLNTKFSLIVFFMLISSFFFQSTYLLKQSISVAFFNLAFAHMIRNNKKKTILYGAISILFHVSSIFAVIILLFSKFIKSKKSLSIFIVLMLGAIILMTPILKLMYSLVPGLKNYLGVLEDYSFGSKLILLKGSPYFIISTVGMLYYHRIVKTSDKNKYYVFSSVIISGIYIISMNTYWAFRVGWFFILPTLVLIEKTINIINLKEAKLLYLISLINIFIILTTRQLYLLLT